MENSIGQWIDTQLQKDIKRFKDEEYLNLQDIYETIFTNPSIALNQIRANLERLLKDFLVKNNIEIKDKKGNGKALYLLIDSYQKSQEDDLKRVLHSYLDEASRKNLKDNNLLTYKEIKLSFSYTALSASYYAEIIRIYGNNGSHANNITNEELSKMAVVSLIGFFDCYKILKKQDMHIQSKDFQDFIYDDLQVIYQTKDDVEEWKRIRFNKLQFHYNLYSLEGKIKKGKIQLTKIIENEKANQQDNYNKNIYFINLDDRGYKRVRKFYKKLTDGVKEEKYFKIKNSQKGKIEYEHIDTIPLKIKTDETKKKLYKWDMCYINLSIELKKFGVDLILFLVFSPEKIREIKDDYNLDFHNLDNKQNNSFTQIML